MAQDGSGDYDSLEKALQVTQSGDVLRLKPGQYEWSPEIKVSGTTHDSFKQQLTFLGDDPKNTQLTINAEKVKNSTIEAQNKPPVFHNLRLNFPSGVTFNIGSDGAIHRCRTTGGTVGGEFYAYDTTFDGAVSIGEGGGEFEKCEVNGYFRFGDDFWAEQTVFNTTVRCGQTGDGKGTFRNCELNNGVVPAEEDYNETRPVLENCVVKPMSNGFAFELERPGSEDNRVLVMYPKAFGCEIEGRIRNSGGKWVGNKFTTGGASFDYFFRDPDDIGGYDDGSMGIWGNIFDGADVKFGDGDVNMYSGKKKIGNYYSEWDGGEDKDGDDISELPRPIPGDGDVVDQHPLMKPDRSAYDIPLN
ncbi:MULTISPECIES: hypothetical protein [Salinibaculum]|uniref:hypothetical protein n=1 Tax=Salinibaculum TaxID=2732368 RepID=UPI0030D37D39